MKKLIYLASIVLISMSAFSQFPANLKVNSDGTISNSPTTVEGKRYRITVEGTYSMWPQFTDCRGVDAAYVYEVPQEEIDAYRWPPQVIQLGPVSIPFVEIPHWVGDPKVWQFPPKELATPLFEMSFNEHIGFRINQKSLPQIGLNIANHRYQVEITGTGKSLEFQILDSNYNIQFNKIIPRYEDNCGILDVLIEEIADDKPFINDLCSNYFLGEKYIINLKTMRDNINITNNADYRLIIGQDTLNNDNKLCNLSSTPRAIHFILDNSGSMLAGIDKLDTIQRIDHSKHIMTEIIKKLSLNDIYKISTFSHTAKTIRDWGKNDIENDSIILNQIELDQRSNLQLLGELINDSSNNIHEGYQNSIIIFSDFADNLSDTNMVANDLLFNYSEPIFIPNFLKGGNETDSIAQVKLNKIKTNNTNTSIINLVDLNALYDYFDYSLDPDCCYTDYDLSPCYFEKDTTLSAILIIEYNSIRQEIPILITFNCNLYNDAIDNQIYNIKNLGSFEIYKIKLYNISGELVQSYSDYDEFRNRLDLLDNGLYLIVIYSKDGIQQIKFNKGI